MTNENVIIHSTVLSYLSKSQLLRLSSSSTLMSISLNRNLFTASSQRKKVAIDNQEVEPEEEGQDLDMTLHNVKYSTAIQEDRVCKQCKDSLKQITSVE